MFDYESEIDIASTKTCRACMSSKCSKLYSIYDSSCSGGSLKIIEMLLAISAIPKNSSIEDYVPENICDICLDALKKSYVFQQKCISSYMYLKNIMQDLKSIASQISNEDFIEEIDQFSEDTLLEEVSNTSSHESLYEMITEEYIEHDESKDLITKIKYTVLTDESDIQNEKPRKSIISKKQGNGINDESIKGFDENSNTSSDIEIKKKKSKLKTEEKKTDNLYFIFEYVTDSNDVMLEGKKQNEVVNKMKEKHENDYLNDDNISDKHNRALCSECGKTFRNSSCLSQHIKRHKGIKKYQCPECPSKFLFSTYLKRHMSIHTKLKPFSCDICGSSFTRSSSLTQHKQTHTGIRPYVCSVCKMSFYRPDKLKRHERIHTGERPYKCEFCSNAYSQSNDLAKHKRVHLGENIYKCMECPSSFRLKSELRLHNQEHFKQKSSSNNNEKCKDTNN